MHFYSILRKVIFRRCKAWNPPSTQSSNSAKCPKNRIASYHIVKDRIETSFEMIIRDLYCSAGDLLFLININSRIYS